MRKYFTPDDPLFFTSDLHFGHKNILEHGKRPYGTLDAMRSGIISEWNSKVGPDGHVFVLGDFSFLGSTVTREILADLNGTKYLLEGNHDEGMTEKTRAMFAGGVKDMHNIKVGDQKIVLCHYAIRSWRNMHHGSWNLHGHSHGNLQPHGKQMDVGYDALGFCPISYRDVEELMAQREIAVVDHHIPKNDPYDRMATYAVGGRPPIEVEI